MNLQMLFADAQEHFTDFSDKKDKGKAKGGVEVINADDPNNMSKMHQMLGW